MFRINEIGFGTLLKKIEYSDSKEISYYEVIDCPMCYSFLYHGTLKTIILSGKIIGTIFDKSDDNYVLIDYISLKKYMDKAKNAKSVSQYFIDNSNKLEKYYYTTDNKHFIKVCNQSLINDINSHLDNDKIIILQKYKKIKSN